MTLSQSGLALHLNRSVKWVQARADSELIKDGREIWKRIVKGTPGRPSIWELQEVGTTVRNRT
jgi:hypothetical protein